MKQLEKEFVSGEGGFSANPLTYTQVARNDKAAVYLRSRDGVEREFEVFKLKVNPKGKKIFNTILEDDEEIYPPSSAFGRWAWTISGGTDAKQRALALFDKLTKDAGGIADDEETTVSVTVIQVPEKKSATELQVPAGKFTHAELADFNQKTKQQVYVTLQQYLKEGKLKLVGERAPSGGKGKASKLFEKA